MMPKHACSKTQFSDFPSFDINDIVFIDHASVSQMKILIENENTLRYLNQ